MSATSQITEMDSRIQELRAAYRDLDAKNDDVVASISVDGDKIAVSADRVADFRKNIATMMDIKGQIEALEEAKALKQWGSQPAGSSPADRFDADMARGAYRPDRQVKSVGQLFTESAAYEQWVKSGKEVMDAPWNIHGVDLGSMAKGAGYGVLVDETKDIYTTVPTGTISRGLAQAEDLGLVTRPQRKVRVRDLFDVRTTDAAVIEYYRVTGFAGLSNASPVPERSGGAFGLSGQTPLDVVSAQAQMRVISHWEAASRKSLTDRKELQSIIDSELLYGLRLREDDQLLNGTGTSEDLLGMCKDPNVQTYTRGGVSGDTKADDLRRAATKVLLAYYEPTGVIVHPTDWELIETLKDSTGAYLTATIAMGAQQKVWRMPVVDTPAMTQGKAMVGAFGLGARIHDRQTGQIRIAEQHSDFFLRRAIVVLAEEELALSIPRPESLVYLTLGA